MTSAAASQPAEDGHGGVVSLVLCSAVEPGFPIIHANPSFEALTGHDASDVIGRRCSMLQGPGTRPEGVARMREALRRGDECRVQLLNYRKDGSEFWNEVFLSPLRDVDGAVVRYVGVLHDVTRRREFAAALAQAALHDPLTGLPNRRLLEDRVGMALERASRDGCTVGMLMLDLDEFKRVNDTLGHGAGDDLLRQVSARLDHTLRGVDTVARLGGDEFAVLCGTCVSAEAVHAVADRVLSVFAAPFELDGNRLRISTSAGIAIAEAGQGDVETVLREADAAMYRAKRRGSGLVEVFDRSLREAAVRRFEMEVELNQALDEHALHVDYQPKVDLATGDVRFVEALVRWNHPGRGPISPAVFIPVAEASGLIGRVGARVLEMVCRDAAIWNAEHAVPLGMCVNLSAAELVGDGLVALVEQELKRHGVAPGNLGIEWTETAALTDHGRAGENLRALGALGCHLAIDDFGTGFASLAHLRDFPSHELKIDRSFVRTAGVAADSRGLALRQAVIALARGFDITSTAEGIETPTQLGVLRQMGCDQGQGFLLAEPGPFDTLAARIAGARTVVQGDSVPDAFH
jgi:diguanylate cyclase (GGDEF)-like protein/PAS domain S-box-containing protein